VDLYVLFFKVALLAYFLSSLGYILSLLSQKAMVARVSTWVLFSAFLIQTASLTLRFLITGHGPVVNLYDAFSFFSWAVTGIYLLLQLKTRTRELGALVSPVAFFLMMIASARLGSEVRIPTALQGSLVPIHITLSILGESLFAVSCLASAMYLLQDHFIKRHRVNSLSRILPPLRDLDRINHFTLLWGFPLLTLGVILGAIWARTVWGTHWHWDPKQVGTFTVWLLYAFLLHQRLAIGWNGRKAALFSIGAFLVLLFAFFGINLYFTKIHRFL
jgi:cytochrome c-type biogenesis protein CcsB